MLLDLVDVFARSAQGGNPVAIVREAEGLDHAGMQALARWFGFSATTFLLPATDPAADYRSRTFNAERELDFSGHATLGAAYAWLAAGGNPQWPGVLVQECAIGLIDVRAEGNGDRLAFQAPRIRKMTSLTAEERAESVRLTNIGSTAVVDAIHATSVVPWRLLRLRSAADVLTAEANARVPFKRVNIGLFGPWAQDDARSGGAQWEMRGFFANEGRVLIEDRVTGKLNAAIAAYLFERGLESDDFVAAQGRCAGADGRIFVSRDEQGDTWIGGDVAIVASRAVLT